VSRTVPHRARTLLGGVFVGAGSLHLARPGMYESIMPDWLPAHPELVYASGVAEIAGGAAVLIERTSRPGGWWLIATLVAVFPANVHMALHPERYSSVPEAVLWIRLPLQALLIAWVHRVAIRRPAR
jgi:uncharacterized membrane protein